MKERKHVLVFIGKMEYHSKFSFSNDSFVKVVPQSQKGNKFLCYKFHLFIYFLKSILFFPLNLQHMSETKWICSGCEAAITPKTENIQKHINICRYFKPESYKPNQPCQSSIDGYSLVSNKWFSNFFRSFARHYSAVSNTMLFEEKVASSSINCGGKFWFFFFFWI